MLNNDLTIINDMVSFEYSTVIEEKRCEENTTVTIPNDCIFIDVRYWFNGSANPPFPRAHFIKNLPCVCIQSLYFYNNNYAASATIEVNWKLKTCTLSNIVIPNDWHIGIRFFK